MKKCKYIVFQILKDYINNLLILFSVFRKYILKMAYNVED